MLDTNESIKDKLIKRGFWIYLFAFITGPIGYFTKMILSADLSVEQIGVLYGIIGLIGLIGTYNDFGFTESLNFFLPKYAVAKDFVRFKTTVFYAFVSQMATSILLGSILFFFSSEIATGYFHSPEATRVIQVFCLFFLGTNALQLTNSIFQSVQETKIQNFIGFIRTIASLAFVAILWKTGNGSLDNYAWTWIFSLLIAIIGSYTMLYIRIYRPYLSGVAITPMNGELFKKTFSYALGILLTANIGMVMSQVDMQLIITFLGPKDAGYYTNYLSLFSIPFLIISPIIGFLFPIISSLDPTKEDGKSKIRAIKSTFGKIFFGISPAISTFFIVSWVPLSIMFFGDKFADSGHILAWSAPFLIFNFLLQINFQILAGLGKTRERFNIMLISLVINIILNILFIWMFGVGGSALAVGMTWIPLWYLSERKTLEFSVPFPFVFFLKNILIAGGVGGIVWYLGNLPLIAEFMKNRIHILFGIWFVIFFHIIAFVLANMDIVRLMRHELLAVLRKKTS